MRAVYCAYIDFANNRSQMFKDNGEFQEFDGFDLIKHIDCSDCVVFVNNLKVLANLFPGGKKYGENYKKLSLDRSDLLEYYVKKENSKKNEHISFRSFSALIGMEAIECLNDMFPNTAIPVAMYEYLKRFGEPHKIRHTLASNTKKIFYAPIKDELWEETKENKHYYYDFETYKHMYAGNKAGILSKHEFKTFSGMLSFDKHSAFPSILINCDMFPIGKVTKSKPSYQLAKAHIIDALNNREWIKVIINAKINGLFSWYDMDQKVTALDIANIASIYKLGMIDVLFDAIKNNDFIIYRTQKQGYVAKAFRDRLVDAYAKKAVLKKGTFERFLEKTMLDMLYGKGIQDHDFQDIEEVQKHFRGRGDNYMDPAWSNLLRGMVEYEIICAVVDNGYTFADVYADTDGIKLPDTPQVREYFKKQNERIIEANRRSGYDIDIGIWDLEAEIEELYVIKPKIYCFNTKNHEFECKHAGVRQCDIDTIFNKLKGIELEHIKKNGFPFVQHTYVFIDGKFEERFIFTIMKG